MLSEPSDKDYLQLESLIQSRRAQLEMAPGHAGQGQGSSSLLDQDEARIAALGLQAEYELLGGTGPDSGDERDESYTQDIAASVYTSDLYINDTADTAVAWEQFKSLFTPAVTPPADAGPAADAATTPARLTHTQNAFPLCAYLALFRPQPPPLQPNPARSHCRPHTSGGHGQHPTTRHDPAQSSHPAGP